MLSVNLSMLCTQRGEFAKGIILYSIDLWLRYHYCDSICFRIIKI
jgi:hypothetical protein